MSYIILSIVCNSCWMNLPCIPHNANCYIILSHIKIVTVVKGHELVLYRELETLPPSLLDYNTLGIDLSACHEHL